MYYFLAKWPRIALVTFALFAFVTLPGGLSTSASLPRQQPPPAPTSTSQSAKPTLLTDPVPDPKQQGVVWFSQTGHTLRGVFLDYWNRYGGLAQFGYPLTEEFFEEVGADNKLYQVQYFERNRFEYHPENAGTQYEVLLGTLGLDFRMADPPSTPIAGAQYFPETGHNLSGAFKEYWDTHGGLFVHGYPITEPQMERSNDGKEYLVQWFERSRLELHPENAGSAHEVLLGLLGRQLSEKKGYPYGWYPLYGHATDYSWLAGYYAFDNKRCSVCGCKSIDYVSSFAMIYPNVGRVRPYGEDWIRILKETGIRDTPPLEPRTFIVVFGQLDDPNSISVPPGTITGSCVAPKFKVTDLQFNPAN